MKILVTGTQGADVNHLHWQSNRSKYKLIWHTTSLVRCLEDMGHQVDNRPVIPGEDLSHYDKVLVGIFDYANGMQAYIFGALYALGCRPDAIVTISDWKTPEIISEKYNLSEEDMEKKLFREFMESRSKNYKEAEEYKTTILKGTQNFSDRLFLFTMFNNHDISKIPCVPKNVSVYNPEPYNIIPESRLPPVGLFNESTKQKRWTVAGIAGLPMKKFGKVSSAFTLPVDIFGNPNHIEGAKKVTEPEVIQSYKDNILCFYPDQGNFGSGWWRNRPRQCADMGCVLYIPNEEEAKLFGPSYVGHTIQSLESMTIIELEELAKQQKEDYYSSNNISIKKQQEQLIIALDLK